ncbi:MAG: CHASE2 domain-containing protein [Leptolyngbyaceae cyanobacterium T60_A2020_046]|nr:CHASE2 domain-containing protein [Leptolyngbyaceae cyanobacterium T60_A2020_046]
MIGTTLANRYCIQKLLGTGGFGKTYLAEDIHHQTRCVVKHLTPASQDPKFLQTARRLFETEATVMQRLGQHDRIPALIDAFELDQQFYLVQAYVEGHPVSAEMVSGHALPEAAVIEFLRETLPILDFIHSQHVIHRDIKPSNLMRRDRDGKIVLIDFGAVKEITTHIQTGSLEQFTVSIGTQGYAPAEQLSGRPRYSSDLHALGMTAIHALTATPPTEIPEHPHTGELLWHSLAPDVSAGLAYVLNRLAHPSVYQRYPSARAALADLDCLDTLTDALPNLVPPTLLSAPPSRWRRLSTALLSAGVTGIVLLIRQVGGWMPLELMVWDRLVQMQPALPPDDRLLVVEITEPDLQRLQRPTPTDATLADAIATLQTHGPRMIGVDLHRELPQGEGHEALMAAFEAENVVVIRKIGDTLTDSIPAPVSVPSERVGFNDLLVDPDGVIRRNLLLASASAEAESEVLYSLGLRLALGYLAVEGIEMQASSVDDRYFKLGDRVFLPLRATFGGYQTIDAAGYQVLLRYRSRQTVAATVSLSEVLDGQVPEAWVRDRIVILGMTAPSAKDLFSTPYSRSAQRDHLMPGVMLHAQMTSQILSAALDDHPLPWAWPDAAEVLWIVAWGAIGGCMGWGVRRPLWLGGLLVGGVGLSVGTAIAAFFLGGWVPVLPAGVAFLGSVGAVAVYRSTRSPELPSPMSSLTLLMAEPPPDAIAPKE